MKKLLIPIVLLISLASCKKKENCHCGEIYNLERSIQVIDVRNNCSEKGKRFDIRNRNEMDNQYVGRQYCDPNMVPW